MPVGTQAAVKGLSPDQVASTGARMLLANTYHLNARPGPEVVGELGGLHRFMGWDGPILTDSGGFQVFSLAKLRRITEAGIEFRSHLDGREMFLGPDECHDVQAALGSDIAMALDECPPYPCNRDAGERAVARTLRWAERFRARADASGFLGRGHRIFGIIQGSVHDALRERCARALREMDFSGYAVGGVSVGEPEAEMLRQVEVCEPLMPPEKPRYVMGVGTPPQLLRMVARGMDMFDCVMPTRLARHGVAFTPDGPINLKNGRFKRDPSPLADETGNATCQRFSRAYVRHLLKAGETLGGALLTMHNLDFFVGLMEEARARIETGDFEAWRRAWAERYEQKNPTA